jgi:hypothetical protein
MCPLVSTVERDARAADVCVYFQAPQPFVPPHRARYQSILKVSALDDMDAKKNVST